MKRLVMLVALIGCKKAEEAAPAPPAPPPAPAPAAPAPTPVAKAAPAKACAIKVSIDHDKVAFDNGSGVSGTTTTDAMDLSPLGAGGVCPATVVASDETPYHIVIHAMDGLTRLGIVDIALDDGKPGKRPTAPAPWKTEVTPDGKLLGRRDPAVPDLKVFPVIALAKDKVYISGKQVAKTTDSGLALTISKALPEHPKNPTIILQADESLPYSIIKDAIAGATTAGYDNVLFAVKTRWAAPHP